MHCSIRLLGLLIAGVLTFHTCARAAEPPVKKIAGIVTEYRHNSHAEVILSRLLQTDTLDGQGQTPRLQLVSLYVDQHPKNDLSRDLADKHGFTLADSIAAALTLGTDKLAVDGVIIVAEHGSYPKSPTEQTVWPKRRFFTEVVDVFEKSGRVVPVFSDKHLENNTADAVWIYETAQRLKIPFMAGSSVTSTWRKPAVDVRRDSELRELIVVSYGGLDSYGFHGMEFLQCLAERRKDGETGVHSVRCWTGDTVWKMADKDDGVNRNNSASYDRSLLNAVIERTQRTAKAAGKPLEELVKEPIAFHINYKDNVRATLFHLNGATAQWAAGWTTTEGIHFVVADLQEDRPFMHFAHLLQGIESMMYSGEPAWPVERTLFSSAMLHAGMTSRVRDGAVILTPELDRRYRGTWNWKQPEERGR